MSVTEMYYDMLLGHIGLYDEGKQLHSMKEVADFIHAGAACPEAFRKATRLSQHISYLKDFFHSLMALLPVCCTLYW